MRASSRFLCVIGVGVFLGCATGEGPGIAPDADPNDPNAPDASTTPNEQPDASTDNGCTNQPCDLTPQCGCDTGQACDLDGTDLENGTTECRSVIAAGQEADNCNGAVGCDAGYVCVGGQCRKYCQAGTDCRSNEFCLINLTFNGNDIPGAVVCTKTCQPELASNNGCPASPQYACRMFRDDPDGIADNGDEYYLSDCGTSGAGGLDTDCTANSSADCQAGFTCVTINGTQNLCKQICVVGGANTCNAGSCTAFADPQPQIAGTTYGFCQ